MKKYQKVFGTIFLAATLLVTGCAGSGTASAPKESQPSSEKISTAEKDTTAPSDTGSETQPDSGASSASPKTAKPSEASGDSNAPAGEPTVPGTPVIKADARDIVIDEEVKGQVSFIVYTPANIAPAGASTPIFLVYGDDAYTEESAQTAAGDMGLDTLAAKANANVIFVNPMGDSWGEADVQAYLYGLVDMWNEDAGSTTGMNADNTKYIGSTQRIYIIADGSGADFAATQLAADTLEKFFVFTTFKYVPTAMLLNHPSAAPTALTCGMPVLLANSDEELKTAFETLNKDVENALTVTVSSENGSLTPQLLDKAWEDVFSRVRRQGIGSDAYCILNIPHYDEYQLTVLHDSADIQGKPLNWDEYIPDGVDLQGEAVVPLVFTFHGGGNNSEFQAFASGWPILASEENFMVVAVDQHVERSAEEITELLKLLLEKYPGIDTTRIYASGFSMGAVKSWQLGENYPELFAGIAPMDAVTEAPAQVKDVIIPTFYVAGEEDGLLVFPHQQAFGAEEAAEGNGDYTLQTILEMNAVDYKGYDATLHPLWGMTFDDTYTVDSENGKHTVTVNTLKSTDGNTYTALASTSHQSHAVLEVNTRAAWEFLSRFSRNADGSISIAQ